MHPLSSELNGNSACYFLKDRCPTLEIPVQETALRLSLCCCEYPLPPLLHTEVVGMLLSIFQWYWCLGGNKAPRAMGFKKPLQDQSLGIQRKCLQCSGMSDCGVCQHSSAKIMSPGVSTTKWPAPSSVSAIAIPWESQWLSAPSSLSFAI